MTASPPSSASSASSASAASSESEAIRYRAAAIGDTGRGNFGHGLDLAWVNLPGVEYTAVADEDPTGRQAAQARTGARRAYADYRQMLHEERPHFVSVCPRWLNRHAELVLACAAAGVRGVFLEKPLAGSLEECDQIIDACERAGTRLAVAHGRRFDPWVQRLRTILATGAVTLPAASPAGQSPSGQSLTGKFGTLRAIAAAGKADQRGGAEDLMVLGTHVLDLARFLVNDLTPGGGQSPAGAAGDVLWAWGRVTQHGHDLTPAGVAGGAEGMGPSGGDGVTAHYALRAGVPCTFQSYRGQGLGVPHFGLTLYGTAGTLSYRCDLSQPLFFSPYPSVEPGSTTSAPWIHLDETCAALPPDAPAACRRTDLTRNQQQALDLVESVEQQRQPYASGADARAAVEMVAAVMESHRLGRRVPFPLAGRRNPYHLFRESSP